MNKMTPAVKRALTHYHVFGRFPKGLHTNTIFAAEEYLTGVYHEKDTVVSPSLVEDALNCPLGKLAVRFSRLNLLPSKLSSDAGKILFTGFSELLGYTIEIACYKDGSFDALAHKCGGRHIRCEGAAPYTELSQEFEDLLTTIPEIRKA